MLEDSCPYCHKASTLSVEVAEHQYFVSCANCCTRGPLQASRELALSLWRQVHGNCNLLRAVVDASPDLILVKDSQCRFIMVNDAMASLYGTTKEDMIGKSDSDYINNQEQVDVFDNHVRSILASGKEELVEESVTDVNTGEIHIYLSLKKPITLSSNSDDALLIIAHDVTYLKLQLMDIKARERRYDYAMNAAGEGIWDWDITKGLVTHNQTWCDILGYDDALVHPLDFFANLVHKDEALNMQAQLNKALSGESDYESEHRIRRIDGSYIWAYDRGRVVERDENGEPLRMVGSFSDVTSRREAEEKLQAVRNKLEKTNAMLEQLVDERTSELVNLNLQLEEMLRKDALTGIANRLAADDFLDRKFEYLKNGGDPFVLMLIDIDHFKRVNDTYGHPIGDRALRHLAKEMSSTLGDNDFLARFGGEEFLLVRSANNRQEALEWAENLCYRIASSAVPHKEPIKLTISIGMLFVDNKDLPIHEVFRITDEYLYQAKNDGRNCVRTEAAVI